MTVEKATMKTTLQPRSAPKVGATFGKPEKAQNLYRSRKIFPLRYNYKRTVVQSFFDCGAFLDVFLWVYAFFTLVAKLK